MCCVDLIIIVVLVVLVDLIVVIVVIRCRRRDLPEVPGSVMSDVRRTFIVQLLEANRRRLLDGYRAQVSG